VNQCPLFPQLDSQLLSSWTSPVLVPLDARAASIVVRSFVCCINNSFAEPFRLRRPLHPTPSPNRAREFGRKQNRFSIVRRSLGDRTNAQKLFVRRVAGVDAGGISDAALRSWSIASSNACNRRPAVFVHRCSSLPGKQFFFPFPQVPLPTVRGWRAQNAECCIPEISGPMTSAD